jgi:hypothetical protein
MKRHTPVRYLDRLNIIERRIGNVRGSIENTDPEVAMLLRQVQTKLSRVMMMVNRQGKDRDQYRKLLDQMEPDPFYERWIADEGGTP